MTLQVTRRALELSKLFEAAELRTVTGRGLTCACCSEVAGAVGSFGITCSFRSSSNGTDAAIGWCAPD